MIDVKVGHPTAETARSGDREPYDDQADQRRNDNHPKRSSAARTDSPRPDRKWTLVTSFAPLSVADVPAPKARVAGSRERGGEHAKHDQGHG